jgi:phosphoenolpyruvate carboxykinase (ATP)
MYRSGPGISKDPRDFFDKPHSGRVLHNLGAGPLYEESLRRGETRLSASGALVAETGAHTGRAPQDKFIVRDALTDETVFWENCQAMTAEHFSALLGDMTAHAHSRDLFSQDLYAGADLAHRLCTAARF